MSKVSFIFLFAIIHDFMKLFTFLTFASMIFSNNLFANSINEQQLNQSTDLVKAGDKYVTLLGHQVSTGDKAPNFKVVDQNFSPVSLTDFTTKSVLISVVPSLDTGICSLQTKRFNDEVANLPDNLVILTISNDLPFAQKRFCKTENIDKIKVLSDSVWRDFGENYGLLIKDMGLLTRSIFLINDKGIVVYKELVANISQHPNYDAALNAIKSLALKEKTVEPKIETTKIITKKQL